MRLVLALIIGAAALITGIIGLRGRRARERYPKPSSTPPEANLTLASPPNERHLDELLDKALADSFPASDPVSSLVTDDGVHRTGRHNS